MHEIDLNWAVYRIHQYHASHYPHQQTQNNMAATLGYDSSQTVIWSQIAAAAYKLLKDSALALKPSVSDSLLVWLSGCAFRR